MNPKISVIICSYNRADSIKDLLKCLLNQELREDFEVIVVDNNSRDNTKQLVTSFVPELKGKLRYFFEPKQGKPYALNLGIKEAKGEILVFTDDDCLVGKDYLTNIFGTFQKYGNEIGLVGGRITPYWADGQKPPKWFNDIEQGSILLDYFNGPLGTLDYGQTPFIIDYARNIPDHGHFYGANISIRKEALDKHGYFSPDMILGQDTEICLRLFRAGVKGVYAPQVIVHHKVNTQKITPKYYYRWHYLRGQYKQLDNIFDKKPFYPFGIPLFFIKQTIMLYLRSFFEKDIPTRIYSRCIIYSNLGVMKRLIRRPYA